MEYLSLVVCVNSNVHCWASHIFHCLGGLTIDWFSDRSTFCLRNNSSTSLWVPTSTVAFLTKWRRWLIEISRSDWLTWSATVVQYPPWVYFGRNSFSVGGISVVTFLNLCLVARDHQVFAKFVDLVVSDSRFVSAFVKQKSSSIKVATSSASKRRKWALAARCLAWLVGSYETEIKKSDDTNERICTRCLFNWNTFEWITIGSNRELVSSKQGVGTARSTKQRCVRIILCRRFFRLLTAMLTEIWSNTHFCLLVTIAVQISPERRKYPCRGNCEQFHLVVWKLAVRWMRLLIRSWISRPCCLGVWMLSAGLPVDSY